VPALCTSHLLVSALPDQLRPAFMSPTSRSVTAPSGQDLTPEGRHHRRFGPGGQHGTCPGRRLGRAGGGLAVGGGPGRTRAGLRRRNDGGGLGDLGQLEPRERVGA
jgi:hypothetical protein